MVAATALVVGCGGSDDDTDTAAEPDTATQADTAPQTAPDDGSSQDGQAMTAEEVSSCLAAAGLEDKPKSMDEVGLATIGGDYFEVPLGAGDFEDPSEPGGFEFFGHTVVFQSEQDASQVESGLQDQFQSGEVSGNVFVGYNADEPPDTLEGQSFQDCFGGA
jgi:hypothetical protein